jgi:transcriptional regulator with XRE-family HTH domain
MKLRILEICKQKGFTQKELAGRVGLSPVGLSKAINGNPTKGTMEKIATALEVPITELFERTPENTIQCPKCGAKFVFKE